MFRSRRDSESRTLWCGNLPPEVSDSVLYELFQQGGPLEAVRRPKDPTGVPKPFAFIVYNHEKSVPYALELFKGTKIFNRVLKLNCRGNNDPHVPVLDTHLSDAQVAYKQHSDSQPHETKKSKKRRRHSRSRSRSRGRSPGPNQERYSDKPQSWDEYNALRGKGSLARDVQYRKDLHRHSGQMRQPENFNIPPDFDALLRMSQQMMIPGMVPGMGLFNLMSGMAPTVPMMPSMYPSTSRGEPSDRGWGRGGSRGEPSDRGWGRGGSCYDRQEASGGGDYDRRGYEAHEARRDDRPSGSTSRGEPSDRGWGRGGSCYDRQEASGGGDYDRRGYEAREARRDDRPSGYSRPERRRDNRNRDERESRSYQPYDRKQSHSYHGRDK